MRDVPEIAVAESKNQNFAAVEKELMQYSGGLLLEEVYSERAVSYCSSTQPIKMPRLGVATPLPTRREWYTFHGETSTNRVSSPYPQPVGVTTPSAQSAPSFATTWLSKMGVMTTPADAREAQRAMRTATAFIFFSLFGSGGGGGSSIAVSYRRKKVLVVEQKYSRPAARKGFDVYESKREKD